MPRPRKPPPVLPGSAQDCSCPHRAEGRHDLMCEHALRAAGLLDPGVLLCSKRRHPMTEDNTYVTPGGRVDCRACQDERDTRRRRRNLTAQYQRQAAAAQARGDQFGALVALLRAELLNTASAQKARYYQHPRALHPEAFTGRPWVNDLVTLDGVAGLTGFSPTTLRIYVGRARKAHTTGTATPQTMPPPATGPGYAPRWEVGGLALWRAAAGNSSTGQRPQPRGTGWAERERQLARVREFAESRGGYVTSAEVAEAFGVHPDTAGDYLDDAGLPRYPEGDGHRYTDEELLPLVDTYLDEGGPGKPSGEGFRDWLRGRGCRISHARALRLITTLGPPG